MRPNRSRLHLIALLMLGFPALAWAQWDTPNRAFHKDTAFPLDGRHLTVPCASCHSNGVTKGTPTSCATCHWVRRQDDPYRTRLGTACEQCHRTSGWSPVKWDHAAATGMPLNLAHKTLDCAGCHKDRVFTAANAACITCHRGDYDRTASPNHAAAGFSTQCTECHRVSDPTFAGRAFNHNAFFPLVGQHAVQNCAACHVDGRYHGTSRDCIGCHRDDYDRTGAPNHAAAGLSTVCDSCHRASDAGWRGVGLDHNQFFPLVGRHATQTCAACHLNGVYKGTARDCDGCHTSQYNRTASPSHVAARFPTTCEVCHRATDTAWTQGRFTHSWFPITSGKHAGNPCSACHQNPNDFTQFTCLTCHGRTKTDDQHKGRTGYRYDSLACYSCHPQGKG